MIYHSRIARTKESNEHKTNTTAFFALFYKIIIFTRTHDSEPFSYFINKHNIAISGI
jgi:hypothetical protein